MSPCAAPHHAPPAPRRENPPVTPALALVGVHKSHGGVAVLRGVDLAVAPGEVVALLGPGGGGKSTLLRCAALAERPDAGRVLIGGTDAAAARGSHRATLASRVGLVRLREAPLLPHLTVRENCALGEEPGLPRVRPAAACARALARVGLAAHGDLYPRQLTAAGRRCAVIARTLASGCDILLFDEPTCGLDSASAAAVLFALGKLAGGNTAMLLVSHELGFVRKAAHRVAFLAGGTIVEDRPTADFLDGPRHPLARIFLSRTR